MTINNPETNSFLTMPNGYVIRFAYASIGAWNMPIDGTKNVTVPEIAGVTEIYAVLVTITDDFNTSFYSFPYYNRVTGLIEGWVQVVDPVTGLVALGHLWGGTFDDPYFSNPAVNRGRVIVMYR